MAGSLFVVATPIGNLGDVTRRAVETLASAGCVVAEDTRRARALLSHLGIGDKAVRSLNAHASAEAVAQVVERLRAGEDVAFVTDAGTPAVSDPGRALVAAAAREGLDVRVIPGPSAVTAAVALSGLVDGPFTFWGFLPRRGSERAEYLARLARTIEPVVLFESPLRLADTLSELAGLYPDRPTFIGRELTKLHEEGLRGTLSELAAREGPWRGEIVVVVAGAGARHVESEVLAERRRICEAALRAALECGANPSRIARALADASGVPKRELYARALELSGAAPEEAVDPPK